MLDAALLFAFLPVHTPPVAGSPAYSQQLLSWRPGEIRCEEGAVAGAAERPAVDAARMDPQRVRPISYRFAIDGAGRTRSIVRDAGDVSPFGQDIGPALAASRFAPGAARTNCEISYTPQFASLAQAPLADLAAYSIFPTGEKLQREGWDRFAAAGDCRNKPRPNALLRAHPDFSKLKATPGARDWSLVAYDTDAEGIPIHVRVAHGTGNDDLDAAAVEAVRASRFTGGARTGCFYPYWRAAAKVAAPERPDEAAMRPANAACPAKVEWATRPTTYYPPAYRKRAIEGWAVVSFDVAPWGEVGNVKLLEAQPSADFGQQAVYIIRSGRVVPSAQGASGCVETVKFLMPDHEQTDEANDPPATD
jgi:TonB family protein